MSEKLTFEELKRARWMGYARQGGKKGVRNRVLVIYTVKCAEFVAQRIVQQADHPDVELLGFDGCTDNQYAVDLLISMIRHPNVGAVLAVGLGCEYVQPEWLADIAAKEGKPAGWFFIQSEGGTLPSIAYGFKRCSLKHKIGPQEKFCNNYPPCREVWASGKKVVKFIGYDAGEHYRSDKVLLRDLADPKYSKWYPLMEWGWDREACIRAIEAAGLPQPGKSSCFFCPSMRAEEIIDLREHYPDLFRRALALEDNARANLKTVQGLGRNYSWRERFGKEFI